MFIKLHGESLNAVVRGPIGGLYPRVTERRDVSEKHGVPLARTSDRVDLELGSWISETIGYNESVRWGGSFTYYPDRSRFHVSTLCFSTHTETDRGKSRGEVPVCSARPLMFLTRGSRSVEVEWLGLVCFLSRRLVVVPVVGMASRIKFRMTGPEV